MNTVGKFIGDNLCKENLPPVLANVVKTFESKFNALNELGSKYEPWQLVAGSMAVTYLSCKFYYFYIDLENGLTDHMRKELWKFLKKIPAVQKKIEAQMLDTKLSIENGILESNQGTLFETHLPAFGLSEKNILENIDGYMKLATCDWKDGMLSGCVYGADDHINDLVTKVYSRFAFSNPMHADIFVDVRKMEAEVIRMTLNLYNGDDESCGTMSSGGTESIMLACRAYRELAYHERGVKRPEMVVPQTGHAAFIKAGNYFKIKVHMVPVDPKTLKADVKKMESYINSNTIMLVGSAPNFPSGAIDPIEDLSQLAIKYKLPLHVDACLGGYLIPFMEAVGFNPPIFDFRLPGVTSISCDTHKYAYTPKGSSVIMYRNKGYRTHQYFQFVEWSGGMYVSPTFAGSRAGALVAMTWATLMSYGRDGYLNATRDIIQTTRYIYKELLTIPELHILAKPEVSIIAFDSKEFNVLNVYDEMTEKGWHLNCIQYPTGVHIAVTKLHTKNGIADRFINDMRESVKTVMANPDRKLGKMAAVYCSKQTVPDVSLIQDVAYLYLDACYSSKNPEKKSE